MMQDKEAVKVRCRNNGVINCFNKSYGQKPVNLTIGKIYDAIEIVSSRGLAPGFDTTSKTYLVKNDLGNDAIYAKDRFDNIVTISNYRNDKLKELGI